MSKIKIGFLGFGNIGMGVYNILGKKREIISRREGLDVTIEKILVRDIHKRRNIGVKDSVLTDNIEEIVSDPGISVVAEFMGGTEPARQYILKALENKKTVVTANKEVIAKHWNELEEAARRNGVGLYFEASVAGGIPVIKVMGESLQANSIQEIMGIINGTTNYILTKMSEEGRSFEDVLKEAQELGYAEPDPTADVEGFDAMYKLSILASLAYHTRVPLDNIYREGITGITKEDILYGKELGYTIRLLAVAKMLDNRIETRVHPTFIPDNHPLAAVRDSYNAVFIRGDAVGNLMLYGRGAGDLPTGSAVVSDIITACRQNNAHRYPVFDTAGTANEAISFNDNWKTEFFVRLTVKDKPGVLAKISGIFGQYGVSIASVIQKDYNRDSVPLIFVIHPAGEQSMRQAVNDIERIDDVIRVENVIRVER